MLWKYSCICFHALDFEFYLWMLMSIFSSPFFLSFCLLITKHIFYSKRENYTWKLSASVDIFTIVKLSFLPLHVQVNFHWKRLQAGSNIYSLMQVRSSAWSLDPVSHSQWKVPRVLIRRCWQPPFTTEHSSTSRGERQMVRITMSFQCQLWRSGTIFLWYTVCVILYKGTSLLPQIFACLIHFAPQRKQENVDRKFIELFKAQQLWA